ncbi:hypothetical protein BJV74DRAFT_855633, partial [Russula compacta]
MIRKSVHISEPIVLGLLPPSCHHDPSGLRSCFKILAGKGIAVSESSSANQWRTPVPPCSGPAPGSGRHDTARHSM